ncbi:MAG TPA: chemotaxis protein CheW [Acidimicrobiales bacterium]|nr:chemotaxis protein CheW [Acidimicrobiales bacterium]
MGAFDDGMEEIRDEFLLESREGLDALDADLLALERDPGDTEALTRVFRTVHTIKGSSGFLGLDVLETTAHVGESLLVRLRDGELAVTTEVATALLGLVDAIRSILDAVQGSGDEGPDTHGALRSELERLRDGVPPEPAVAPASTTPAPAPDGPAPREPGPATRAPATKGRRRRPAPIPTNRPRLLLGQILVEQEVLSADQLDHALGVAHATGRQLGEVLLDLGMLTFPEVADALVLQSRMVDAPEATATPAAPSAPTPAPTAPGPSTPLAAAADSTVRVDVRLLDRIVTLVGGLVLARNQIVQSIPDQADRDAIRRAQTLSHLTSDLQEQVLRTRMQPVGTAWKQLPRVVRDLATTLGKDIRVEMEGESIEVDRALVEAIKDPLVHLVRNAVDHGVELPDAREAAGKPRQGVMRLRARQEGGQVIIEVADDGAGIAVDRVRRRARERELLPAETLDAMSDHELANLVFLPGFSTAEQVTNISGRGVGMDVVKSSVEAVRGTLEVRSIPGSGTTFRMAIPLTLAILPALMVLVGDRRFALPQTDVRELVRLSGDRLQASIERVHDAPVLRLRRRLLPLVDLGEALGLPPHRRVAPTVVVVRSGDRVFGIVVDRVAAAEEIVVHPLGEEVDHAHVFGGGTITGDGRATLILDVGGLARDAGIASTDVDDAEVEADEVVDHDCRRYLTALVGSARAALDMDAIERLEKVRRDDVEQVGAHEVVRYRGRLLPLVRLHRVLGVEPLAHVVDRPFHRVVVTSEAAHHSIGLVVDEVRDVVAAPLAAHDGIGGRDRPGVVGSVSLGDRVAEVVDVAALVAAVAPTLPDDAPVGSTESITTPVPVGTAGA